MRKTARDNQLLRVFVRQILRENQVSPPEGDPEDPLGEYVFAELRDDVPQPAEPNTPVEEELAQAYNKHYHGRPGELQKWIDEILKLQPDYPEFFEVPPEYTHAYRTITVPVSVMAQVLGREITDEDRDGTVHVSTSGMQPGSFKGKNFFSWTVDPSIFLGLKKDWGSLFKTDWIRNKVGASGFVAFLRASVGGNTFFNNPVKMSKTGLAGQFDYQREVISVDEVVLDRITYFYFDESTDDAEEASMIQQAVDLLE